MGEGRGEHATGEVIAERYEVVNVLGRGGTSVTYQAVDRTTGEAVALKQLRLWDNQAWKGLELFEREAKTLAGLSHPGVPRFLEDFQLELPGGRAFYIARELVAGTSLSAWVEGGARLDEAGVENVARRLLGILADLHALAPPVIHRDIKPSNVLRREDGEIFLVDFGAVRRTDSADGSTVVGTYGYMAPEQFRGHAEPASDLYGVGATLLFLLTHKPPSELPQRGLRVEFRPSVNVSPRLADWLERMLDPDPERRFRSAAEALRALDAPAQALATASPPTPSRSRLPALLAALAVVLAAAGAIIITERARMPKGAHRGREAKMDQGIFLPALRGWQGTDGAIDGLAFIGDGNHVAHSSRNGALKLWRVDDKQLSRTFQGASGPAHSLAVSSDGTTMVSAAGGDVVVWAVERGERLRTMTGHQGKIISVGLTPDGRLAASTGEDSKVIVWEVATGARRRTFDVPGAVRVNAVALSADGATVAAGSKTGRIHVWEVDTGKTVQDLPGHEPREVDQLLFTSDGKTLVSAGDDGVVVKWLPRQRRELCRMTGHNDEVWTIALHPNEQTLLAGTRAGTIHTWNFEDCRELNRQPSNMAGVTRLAVSPDGARFAAGDARGWVAVWAVQGRVWMAPLPPEDYQPPPRVLPTPKSPVDKLVIEADDILDRVDEGADTSDARAKLKEALELDAAYPPAHAVMARYHLVANKRAGDKYQPAELQTARAQVDEALRLDPRLAKAVRIKARIAMLEKNYGEANALADQALALEPENPLSLLVKAHVEQRQEHDDAVLALCRKVIESSKDPDRLFEAYEHLEPTYARLGEHAAVARAYLAQTRLNPKSAWAWGNYAGLLIRREECDRAIAAAKRALDLMDYGAGRFVMAEAHSCKARRAVRRKDLDEARDELATADRVADNVPDVSYVRGGYLAERAVADKNVDLLDEAREAYQRAAKLDPAFESAVQKEIDKLPSYRARIESN